MSIENFDLDDKSFQQLVEEARKKISQVSNQWTNYNISDPGITLLELFAFLADNQMYVLNKITKNHYLKFLQLLGIRLKEPSLPKVELTLFSTFSFAGTDTTTTTTTNTSCQSMYLPKNLRLVSKKENLFLETDEDLYFIPSLKLRRCFTFSDNQLVENDLSTIVSYDSSTIDSVSSLYPSIKSNTSDNNSISKESKKPFFYVFGQNPIENSRFYLCLEYDSEAIKNEIKVEISLYFKIYDKDLPPLGKHGDEKLSDFLDNIFYSKIKWEYSFEGIVVNNNLDEKYRIFDTSDVAWEPLDLLKDSTDSFTQSGKIHFKLPRVEKKSNKSVLWIRATLIKNNNYFVPPRLESILCNTVSTTMGFTTEQALKNRSSVLSKSNWINENPLAVDVDTDPDFLSNGLANQIFEVDDFTKLPVLSIESLKIKYFDKDCKKGSEEWKRVYDFDSSQPLDRHYMILDKKNGIVKFGDGENGKIPPVGAKVILKYKTGNLENNLIINEGKVFEVDSYPNSNKSFLNQLPNGVFGVNLLPSTLGKLDEDLKEAVIRARGELLIPFKAVSKKDCEYIVANTPGLWVGKVKVFTNEEVEGSLSSITILDEIEGNMDFVSVEQPENLENTLFISAIPYSFSKKPIPNKPFLNTILKHLDKHRLITTRVKMVVPEYIGISIAADIRLHDLSIGNTLLKQKIYDILEHVFRPLPHSFENKEFAGWDYGKNVYKSEVISIVEKIEEVDAVFDVNLDPSGRYGSFKKDREGNIQINNLNLVYLKELDISFF